MTKDWDEEEDVRRRRKQEQSPPFTISRLVMQLPLVSVPQVENQNDEDVNYSYEIINVIQNAQR